MFKKFWNWLTAPTNVESDKPSIAPVIDEKYVAFAAPAPVVDFTVLPPSTVAPLYAKDEDAVVPSVVAPLYANDAEIALPKPVKAPAVARQPRAKTIPKKTVEKKTPAKKKPVKKK